MFLEEEFLKLVEGVEIVVVVVVNPHESNDFEKLLSQDIELRCLKSNR